MCRQLFISLFGLLVSAAPVAFAQVANNKIDDRILLQVNERPIESSTAHATVEWDCVNRALTRKCLVYHNDQWFAFKVDLAGKYFIKITAQQCKASKGVQLIAIEGDPCKLETYKLLRCILQIRQEDVFIELDSLKPGVEYLLNVDGFLGDFCEFEISVTSRPFGFPLQWQRTLDLPSSFQLRDSVVFLNWQLPDSLTTHFRHFLIYRKQPRQNRFIHYGTVAGRSNAYGAMQRQYQFNDTLREGGLHRYQMVGITADDYPVLVAEENVTYTRKVPPQQEPPRTIVNLVLSYPAPTRLSFVLYNQIEYSQLEKWKVEFDPAEASYSKIDFAKWIQQGHKSFLLLIMDEFTNTATEYYFQWDGSKIIQE